MNRRPDPTDPPTRPESLWPSTGLAADSSAFSGFDPGRGAPAAQASAAADAAFDVCHPALALRAVLLVQAALAVVALAGAESLAHWMPRQAALAFGGAFATLLWLVGLCAVQRALHTAARRLRATLALGLGAVAALLPWAGLAWAGLVAGTAWQGAAVLLGGVFTAALLWAWLDLRERARRPVDSRARLAELQSRIRPHFLFNTLNSAVALVRADPERAERVLEDLAELFRTALADAGDAGDGASVTLAEELELARRYLEIEALRFGPRLMVHWDLDERAGAARVPPLVLQPLAENAVRHGVEPSVAGGIVWLRTRRRHGQVELTVSNTLGPVPGPAGQGLALANVRERLRLLHDVAVQFDTWREPAPGGQPGAVFHARIVLPAP